MTALETSLLIFWQVIEPLRLFLTLQILPQIYLTIYRSTPRVGNYLPSTVRSGIVLDRFQTRSEAEMYVNRLKSRKVISGAEISFPTGHCTCSVSLASWSVHITFGDFRTAPCVNTFWPQSDTRNHTFQFSTFYIDN
jgi:hypothetical protein